MIILGIDPGTASTGYGIVQKIENQKTKRPIFKCLNYGVIKTSPDSNPGERLKRINNELSKIIKKYRPDSMAVENIYFFKNWKTVIPVSQAEGVILLTAAKNKVSVHKFTPLQAKLAVTGNGRAEKKDVQEKLKEILKLKEIPKPDDAADALAIAITCIIKISPRGLTDIFGKL